MNKVLRLSLIQVIILCFAMPSFAQQISEEQAMQTAKKFFKIPNVKRAFGASNVPLKLAYTSKKGDETHYYVFNSTSAQGGFVIVGGDESAREILGYSDHGTFDYNNIPDNMKWWLSQYDADISQSIRSISAGATLKKVAASTKRADIAPLIKSKWNQSAPYNNLIPKNSNGGTQVTGCVATAMAQVMNYHKWPKVGTSSYSYERNSVTYSADFSATTYDWDNMCDTYISGEYSDAQANAVATLMYHAGVAVNMKYGVSGSSANSIAMAPALANYFGYDKGMITLQRAYYTDDEWEQMIYDELKEGRPLLYSGVYAAGNSGHEFICDGYTSDLDFFSFNWGWGGADDGYYAITGTHALQPNTSGIGGAGAGASYTSQQDATFGIQRDKGGDYNHLVCCYNSYSLKETFDGADAENITIDRTSNPDKTAFFSTSAQNFALITDSYNVGIMFKEAITGKTYYRLLGKCGNVEHFGYSALVAEFPTNILTYNGKYKVYPVYSIVDNPTESDWKIMRQTGTAVPTITITGGTDDEKVDVDFTISDLEVQVGRSITVNPSEEYTGEYTCTSSNPDVVTIEKGDDGVTTITGKAEGSATLTLTAAGDDRYNATTKTFDIVVSSTVKDELSLTLENTSLAVSENMAITHDDDYTGTITYSSSNTDVATVSTEGSITGVAEGTANITAYVDGNNLYKKSMKVFAITVTPNVTGTVSDSVVFTYRPVAGINNTISTSVGDIPFTTKNCSGKKLSILRIYADVYNSSDNLLFTKILTANSVAAGAYTNGIYHFADSLDKYNMQPGDYTIKFYREIKGGTKTAFNFPSISVKVVNDTTINYTMTDAGYGTICLPFDASVPDELKAYECLTYNENNIAQLTRKMKIVANTPFILRGTAGTYSFTGPKSTTEAATVSNGLLVGVLTPSVVLLSGHYIMQNHSGVVGFYKVGNGNKKGTSATRYRCLMQVPTFFDEDNNPIETPLSVILPTDADDEVDAIQEVSTSSNVNTTEGIYDLTGRRITKSHGISIIRQKNGTTKKVIM